MVVYLSSHCRDYPFSSRKIGVLWNYRINGTQAMILIVIAASWKQISYNFLFFLTGLQSVPHSQIEAAAIDGAGPFKRFWTIVFPQISPTTFFSSYRQYQLCYV